MLWTILLSAAAGFLLTPETGAAQAIPDQRLTLDEAVARTLADNPELTAAGLAIDIERLRRDRAALPPPLALNAEIENFAGTGASEGLADSEVTVAVSRLVERGGQADLRREIGEQRVAQASTVAEVAQLSLAARVTQRFIDVLALQDQLTLAEQRVDIASQTFAIVNARVEVGRSLEADRSSASVVLSRAELARERARGRLDAARMRLASLWGAAAPAFSRATGDLYALPEVDSFEALVTRLDANPGLLRRAAEVRVLEAERRLAAANVRPNVSLSGGLRHLGQTDDLGLVFSVSMPFGSRVRAQPEVDAANLQLEQAPLATEAERRELRAQLYVLHQELSFARTALEALQDTIIPEAENAVSLYDEAFAVGSSTLLELVEAQDRLLALRAEALASASAYQSTLAEIRYLLGGG